MRLFLRVAVYVHAVVVMACGSASPSAPTPQIPNVIGSYAGSMTLVRPEVQSSLTCPASTTVTQSGSTVTIAPIVLGGVCGVLSIPVGQAVIDTTGAITGSNTGTFFEPTCGGYSYTASGGFFGRELRLSMSATSATCLNFNFTAVLSR